MRHKPAKILKVIPLCLLLTACDTHRHLHDLETFVLDTKLSTGNKTKKNLLENMHEPKSITYSANNLRSPFESSQSAGALKSSSYMLKPLQAYPLAMLRYKGYAMEATMPTAFILTPDDKVHSVTLGDTIGDHYGKIVSIYPDHLEVKERVETPNADGVIQISQRIVTLQRKEGADAEHAEQK